jgi:hypothetical protein
MDKEKEKTEEVVEEVEKKSINWKRVIQWFLFTVVSLVGVFFLSTYIRWNAEISDKYEIIYTGQEEVKINELKNYLGFDIEAKVEADQAIKAYCSSKYGESCVAADYTSGVENLLRSPRPVVAVVLLIDLIILYIIFKERLTGKIRTYIYGVLIILFGLYIVGYEVFGIADYYFFVNGNKNVVDGTIIKGLIPNNGKEFRPLISYEVEEKEYVKDIDIKAKEVGKEITVYYNKKAPEKIEVKRSMLGHIFPSIVGIATVVLGVVYLKINKKKEINEEEKKAK